ncbi:MULTISPECIES: hypothetical protein [unclassified Nocardiopsis]|uniref:hypothetical protein n=1 Tax=Nocardiopsis TaxID=2013 RepID=UPI00387A92BF
MRHLRAAELTEVRRIAGDFSLNRMSSAVGDLLSPEFSPARPAPRPAGAGGLTLGRVIPLRPDLARWTRPLVGGEPLHLLPGRGRHHRPEAPVRLTLAGYNHPAPAVASADALARITATTDTERPFAITAPPPAPAPARQPRRWPRIRRCASRVRAYVSHPAGDLAPLALAIRSYLAKGVR